MQTKSTIQHNESWVRLYLQRSLRRKTMDTTEIERELDDFKKCLDYIEKAQSQKGTYASAVVLRVIEKYTIEISTLTRKIEPQMSSVRKALNTKNEDLEELQKEIRSADENLQECQLLKTIGAIEEDEYNKTSQEITSTLEDLRSKESNVISRQNHYQGIIQRWSKLVKESNTLQDQSQEDPQEQPEDEQVSAVSQKQDSYSNDEGNTSQGSHSTNSNVNSSFQDLSVVGQSVAVPSSEMYAEESNSVMDLKNPDEEMNDVNLENFSERTPFGQDLLGDEILGEEVLGEEILGEEILGEEILGEEILGEEILGEEILGEEILGEEILGDEILGNNSSKSIDSRKNSSTILEIDDTPSANAKDLSFELGEAKELSPDAYAILVQDEGTADEKVFPITADTFTLGRSSENDNQIKNDSKVSRRHCKIFKRDNSFYIEDLKSSNGTQVNGDLITERRLYGGELLKVGETLFRFSISDT